MWERDEASRSLGLELEHVEPGGARMSMRVEQRHTNGHGICHGGFIFTLADSAFAFACNSYNQLCVAQHNAIHFLAPAKQGDRLQATAHEVTRAGRSGLYDVQVINQDDVVIAEMRGASRAVKGQHVPDVSPSNATQTTAKPGDGD